MNITGRTEEGIPVVGGAFKLYGERGVPIVDIIQQLHASGLILDWADFCVEALQSKWKLGKVYSLLREAVGEVYPPRWVQEWDRKMIAWCRLRAGGHIYEYP